MLFLVFRMAGERYALNTADIVEVLPCVNMRPLPGAPDCVRGVFNYHGDLIPVIDVARLAFDGTTDIQYDSRIALIRTQHNTTVVLLGILLEGGTTLLRRDAADFRPPPVETTAAFAGDIATDEAGMVQRLDLQRLLTPALWDMLTEAQAELRV